MLQIETIVDSNSHKAPVCQQLAALGGILVVALAGDKATSKDIEYTSMVGTGMLRLVDIQLQFHRVAMGKSIGLLGRDDARQQQCSNQQYKILHTTMILVMFKVYSLKFDV